MKPQKILVKFINVFSYIYAFIDLLNINIKYKHLTTLHMYYVIPPYFIIILIALLLNLSDKYTNLLYVINLFMHTLHRFQIIELNGSRKFIHKFQNIKQFITKIYCLLFIVVLQNLLKEKLLLVVCYLISLPVYDFSVTSLLLCKNIIYS